MNGPLAAIGFELDHRRCTRAVAHDCHLEKFIR